MDIPYDVGQCILSLHLHTSKSQKEISTAVGVSQQRVSDIVNLYKETAETTKRRTLRSKTMFRPSKARQVNCSEKFGQASIHSSRPNTWVWSQNVQRNCWSKIKRSVYRIMKRYLAITVSYSLNEPFNYYIDYFDLIHLNKLYKIRITQISNLHSHLLLFVTLSKRYDTQTTSHNT